MTAVIVTAFIMYNFDLDNQTDFTQNYLTVIYCQFFSQLNAHYIGYAHKIYVTIL